MKFSAALACALGMFLLASCASRNSSASGFLSNYAQLGSDPTSFEAAAVYLDPGADFKKYDSIMVEEVAIRIRATNRKRAR